LLARSVLAVAVALGESLFSFFGYWLRQEAFESFLANRHEFLVSASSGDRDMSKASKNRTNETLQRLETELDRLKSKFQMGHELTIQRTPTDGPKSGEVTGTTIRIYESDKAKALDTLRHEFVEYLLTQDLVAPYKRLINKLISLFEEEMYDRKDKLVQRLEELIRKSNRVSVRALD
jgi:hypothetical protein